MGHEIVPIAENTFLGRVRLEGRGSLEGEEPPTFVGGVSFNAGQKLTVIGDLRGRLVTSGDDQAIGVDARAAIRETGRLLELDTFSDVKIRQVGVAAIEFHAPQTLRRRPTVSLHFNAVNPATEDIESLVVDERDIRSIFTGKKGGVVVFSGKGLHEETGLLFERDTEGGRSALILFMHPNVEGLDLNSIEGLKLFTQRLAEEFGSAADVDLQVEALAAMEKSIRKGRLKFDEGVREQIFRLHVISVARTHEDEIDWPSPKAKLKRTIPDFKRGLGKRTGSVLHVGRNYQSRVDEEIDGLVVDYNHPPKSEASSSQKLQREGGRPHDTELVSKIGEELQTLRAQALWENTMEGDVNENNPNTRLFLSTVALMIAEAGTAEEFEDIDCLLKGLYSTKYRNKAIVYELNYGDDNPDDYLQIMDTHEAMDNVGRVVPTLDLRTRLIDESFRRQKELGITS